MKQEAFEAFVRRYYFAPVLFVREVYGVEPDEWQAKFLNSLLSNRRVAVKSGHGVGKTTAASWAASWFLATRYKCKIVVTAPTTSQLYDAFYPELLYWMNQLPEQVRVLFEVKAERIELIADRSCFLSIRTSRAEKPDALQGVHSDHVMLIADEASGVPEAVFEAAAGSMSGESAVTVLLGNPVRSSGYFYKAFYPDPDTPKELRWKTFTVSCMDSPRVSKDFVNEIKATYGEDSNPFRVRVLGEFPKADDDTVIPRELLEAARLREVTAHPDSPMIWGVDVARYGSDSSVLVKRRGPVVEELPKTWRNFDTMQLTGAIANEYDATAPQNRPLEILVDAIGIGAGVVDRLRELGYPARGINVSESPAFGDKYLNLRAELWMKAKAWIEKRDCKLPSNAVQLVDEAAGVRYTYTTSGKVQIESKESMRKRMQGKSPDIADAWVLTFASDAATGLHGYSSAGSWSKPFRRNIAGIV